MDESVCFHPDLPDQALPCPALPRLGVSSSALSRCSGPWRGSAALGGARASWHLRTTQMSCPRCFLCPGSTLLLPCLSGCQSARLLPLSSSSLLRVTHPRSSLLLLLPCNSNSEVFYFIHPPCHSLPPSSLLSLFFSLPAPCLLTSLFVPLSLSLSPSPSPSLSLSLSLSPPPSISDSMAPSHKRCPYKSSV